MSEPYVSVIMPVRNEESFIARSLGAALAQDYPADRIEVIVADGQSDDRTRAIIRELPGSERVKVIDNPRRWQSCGLNLALRRARGEIIVRVDGHTMIAPDYVRQCVRALRETEAVNVGGRMEPRGETRVGRAIAAAGSSRFGVPTAFHVSDKPQFTDTVYLGAWPRETLIAAGGFDERLPINEDYELNYRLRQAGGRVYLSPTIHSTYYGRQTLGELARQYYAYGWGRASTLRLHPGSLKPRQLVAPIFVGALVVGMALAPLGVAPRLAWLVLLGIYALANGVASTLAAWRAGWDSLVITPAVFVIMHIAWGLGFWAGVAGFAPRRWAGAALPRDRAQESLSQPRGERLQ